MLGKCKGNAFQYVLVEIRTAQWLTSVVAIVFSPLGPFVPAPPEIAMHMMREQGPPPFEPNGAPHGNTGMLGPMMGGPAPIITMPPNFRHDPRRLRRLTLNSRLSVFSCLVALMCIMLFCC